LWKLTRPLMSAWQLGVLRMRSVKRGRTEKITTTSPDVLKQLEADYRVVPPVPKRFVKGDNTDEETRARIAA
jgi:hypothetical protein